MTLLLILTPLLLYFPVLLWTHRIVQRRLSMSTAAPTPAQGTALKVVVPVSTVFVLFVAGTCASKLVPLPWGVWASVVLLGGGYFYWLFVCITESARRYKIATLIDEHPSITEDEVVARYDSAQIIDRRLERLTTWGTLQHDGHRYRSRPSLLLLASRLIRTWAIILGFEWPRQIRGSGHRSTSSN